MKRLSIMHLMGKYEHSDIADFIGEISREIISNIKKLLFKGQTYTKELIPSASVE